MEVNRYPRKERIGKDGKAPIRLMVHYHNKRMAIPTGEKVAYPEGWDEARQEVKSRQPFAGIINQKLNNMEKVLHFVYQASEKARQPLDNDSFKETFDQVFERILATGASSTDDDFTKAQLQQAYEAYKAELQKPASAQGDRPQQTLLELMAEWIEEEKHRIVEATGRVMSPNTIKGLNSTLKRFEAFEEQRKTPITFEGMDKYFYAEFRAYMLKELDQGVNNFGKHVRRLKQFLTWCEDHDEDLPINPKYVRFSAPSKYKGVDFLRLQQLEAIKKLNFKSEEIRTKLHYSYSNKLNDELDQEAFDSYLYQVELARDIFLMCCYTGLRISDAQTLTKTDIKGELIVNDNQKTGNISYIPYFNDEIFAPVILVQKYLGIGDRIFPPCPKINKHLKLIQKLAGIEGLVLTTKIGRKTFATLKIYQGVPKPIVMQATGHKTEGAFNRYLGVDEQELLKIFKEKSAASSS